jgi:hypothetical protein
LLSCEVDVVTEEGLPEALRATRLAEAVSV